MLDFDAFNFLPQSGYGLGIYTLFNAASPISGSLGVADGLINGTTAFLWIDTVNHDILLGVVPEPSTFSLAALGLLGLASFGRRRKRVFQKPVD
jgi:MYXO-CTERM domain-containing protein